MFKKLLGIDLPIIQAPMAGVQDSALAIAVSVAGGLGSLPCGMLNTLDIELELTKIKDKTDKPFNINFFCHKTPEQNKVKEEEWYSTLEPYFLEYGVTKKDIISIPKREPFSHKIADIVMKYKPKVVSFHFGLPSDDLLARVRGWGAKILSSATTIEEAIWLESRGVDGIIAQGLEAGGHRGMFLTEDLTTQSGIFTLLPQILKNVGIPVIAAGGIADKKGVSAALSLGAVAVQVGTSYLLCKEAKTSQIHREALKCNHAHHTAVTNIFSGRPARSIINRAIKEIGAMPITAPPFPLASKVISVLRHCAEKKGSSDFTPLWSGQNVTGCREISAKVLTHELAKGYTSSLEIQ